MVNHGPEREPPEWSMGQGDDDSNDSYDEDDEAEDGPAADPIYFDFEWRGTCSGMPDVVLNNPLITKGKIEFGTTHISGFFEGMSGPSGERCDFDGEALWGPRRVPRTLQSFIDDWNDFNYFGEDETVRPAPSSITEGSSSQSGQTYLESTA